MSFTVDAGLNLLWLGISVSALFWFGRMDRRRSGGLRLRTLLPVFLATVTLFPAVSDSDDLFSFSLMQIPVHKQGGVGNVPEDGREKDSLQLARVLESLGHFRVAAVYQLALALCFVSLLLTLRLDAFSRPVYASSGRSPPLA